MTLEMITAKAGEPHVDSGDVGAFNACFFGNGNYLISGGTMTLTSANTLHIAPAEALLQGRHVRITDAGEDVSISNGTTGYNRNDLVCFRYEKYPDNNDVEAISLVVITGTPTTEIATDPTVPSGSILNGDNVAYVPIARITLTGLTPVIAAILLSDGSRITAAEKNITSLNNSKVPTTRTVNGKALSANVTLAASDVGAVPTSRTVNGKALSANVTLAASDIKTTAGTTVQAWLEGAATTILKKAYPVGAIYISTVSTSPATLFGFGTWTQITDRFLLAAGSTYKAGATGGSATHTLTVNQIPAHQHATMEYQSGRTGTSGGSADGIQWSTALTGTWKLSTGETGGGAAHNNMPPYLVVYAWKRTA